LQTANLCEGDWSHKILTIGPFRNGKSVVEKFWIRIVICVSTKIELCVATETRTPTKFCNDSSSAS